MDLVGGGVLADATECKVLIGIDDHSRYCVAAGVMTRAVRSRTIAWIFVYGRVPRCHPKVHPIWACFPAYGRTPNAE